MCRWDQGAAVATGGFTPVNLVWPKEDRRCGDGRSVSEAVQPIIGILVQADHGQDAHLGGAVLEQDAVGEGGGKMAADLAPDPAIRARMRTRFRDQALDLVLEATAQLGADPGVILGGRGILRIRLAMEAVRFHRPTIRRI